uniref:tRNA-specific adenosine deaminase-like protein 3 n=1 Tax=Caligus rogercresseyi TaxID=217165 RepID=C1BNE2_CALRO|nr:tRNA-specific adenosine deaminase-like protein 3 [Caligus rogercresseyi]
MSRSILIRPILCDTITRPSKTKEVLALELPDKKSIFSTIKSLSPLNNQLRHCKRIRIQEEEDEHKILCLINDEDKKKFNPEQVKCVTIPEFPCIIRRQFEESKALWPLNFHPDARLEALMNEETPGIWDSAHVHHRYLFEQPEAAAAIIVDPARDSIVALGHDGRPDFPLKHPVMNAIEELSRKKESEYLASGLDIYLKNEPCAMCSMALVHMRIKRIFFIQDSPQCGALKSRMKLHTLPGINHVFQVFQVFTTHFE